MISKRPGALRGVYAIADTAALPGDSLVPAVEAALSGGAALVQYRDKSGDAATRRAQAALLKEPCDAHGAALIINDDIELARTVGADGVHIGEHDMPLAAARAALGGDALIGVSCYNDIDRARRAATAGADYIAFGSVFPSVSKPGARHAPLELFTRAGAELDLPLCAIGGINATNAERAIEAGADLIAVINGIFGQNDIEAATRELTRLFD